MISLGVLVFCYMFGYCCLVLLAVCCGRVLLVVVFVLGVCCVVILLLCVCL